MPDQLLPDHDEPDQLLPDHDEPYQRVPFHVPPDHADRRPRGRPWRGVERLAEDVLLALEDDAVTGQMIRAASILEGPAAAGGVRPSERRWGAQR